MKVPLWGAWVLSGPKASAPDMICDCSWRLAETAFERTLSDTTIAMYTLSYLALPSRRQVPKFIIGRPPGIP